MLIPILIGTTSIVAIPTLGWLAWHFYTNHKTDLKSQILEENAKQERSGRLKSFLLFFWKPIYNTWNVLGDAIIRLSEIRIPKIAFVYLALFIILWITPSFLLTNTIQATNLDLIKVNVPRVHWDEIVWNHPLYEYTSPLIEPTLAFILSGVTVATLALLRQVFRK
jgi:hypothetical protein